MKANFKKWLKKNNRDAEGIRIGSVMPSNDGFELFNQFAEEYAEKKAEPLIKGIEHAEMVLSELNRLKTFKSRWGEITACLCHIEDLYKQYKDES
jgi:hypothetical protein